MREENTQAHRGGRELGQIVGRPPPIEATTGRPERGPQDLQEASLITVVAARAQDTDDLASLARQ